MNRRAKRAEAGEKAGMHEAYPRNVQQYAY